MFTYIHSVLLITCKLSSNSYSIVTSLANCLRGMLAVFCFLSVIKLTNLHVGYKKLNYCQELQRNLELQRQTPRVLYNAVIPEMQSELTQWNNDICPGLSLKSTRVLRALTLQEPAHKTG